MLYLGRDVILSALDTADHPLIGYQNVVTVSNIAADSQATGSPASNLANPATHLKWVSNSTSDQDVTITLDGLTEIGYVGIAGHNFGSTGATVSIEATIGGSPVTLADEVIPGDDSPLLFWLDDGLQPTAVRIHLAALSEAPSAAVVYAGVPLSMERRIYTDHTPITMARKLDISNGRSESGEFLGRVVTGERRESMAAFKFFTPAWYRANMPAFLLAAKTLPFFFAWRPTSYPDEVGYVFLMDDPMPAPQSGGANLIAFELKIGGVV